MGKPKVALLISGSLMRQVFTPEDLAAARRDFDLIEHLHETPLSPEQARPLLIEAEGALNSWNSPRFNEDLLAAAPKLRAVAYAAGTVKSWVTPGVYDRGIAVSSAAAHIAVDVAQMAVGIMVVASKNMFQVAPLVSGGTWCAAHQLRFPVDDLRFATVGIVAASHIGRNVMRLLREFDVRILLYDPYVDEAAARELGATKADLPKLFAESDIVSCHAPLVDATRGMIGKELISTMKTGAVFINTSRGAIVDEAALVEALKADRIRAFLDVTDPEPPPPNSPLYHCPNLVLTPHIAGSVGRARRKLGGFAADELRRFFRGEPFKHAVTREMLDRIG